jgi:hypothetical protein
MFPEGDYLWLPGRLAAKIHRREGSLQGLSPSREPPFLMRTGRFQLSGVHLRNNPASGGTVRVRE